MSILTELFRKQITWAQAEQQIEQWETQVAHSLANDPVVLATTAAVASTLKQAASDAISLADQFAGPVIAAGAATIEATTDGMFKAYFGPYAPIASKATHDSADRIAAALIALIHERTAAFKASMPAPAQAPQQPSS